MLIALIVLVVAKKSRNFWPCSANEQVCRTWEGAQPRSQPKLASGNIPYCRCHVHLMNEGWPGGKNPFFPFLFHEFESSLVTEAQNNRMVGLERVLWRSSSPTPLPKQGHLEQAAQDPVQAGLEYLQRRRLHNSSGQPVPVLCHPQTKGVLPHVQTELMLQFVPVAPCPVTGHH